MEHETMRQRMAGGRLFSDLCEGLPEERREAKRRMCAFNASSPDDPEGRLRMQREMLHAGSGSAWIEPPFYFCYGTHILLGENVYVNFNCNFVDDGQITVGGGTLIGPGVTVLTVGHPVCPELRQYMYCDRVEIGKNCWIGAQAVLCPGVHIGENSVIGAGSVVTKDIPPNVVAFGNPCRVLRSIEERDRQFYYRDRPIDVEDLEQLRSLELAGR